MNYSPLFSIITVSYNSKETIQRTLESVLNQNNKNYEYIIKDGLSTDGTIGIVNNYKDKIDIFMSNADDGIYDAMNTAIGLSNGKWIIFLNSDDYFYDNTVLDKYESYLNKYCNENNKCIVYYSNYTRIYECYYKNIETKENIGIENFYYKQPINHQSCLFKKDCFNKVGLYNPTLEGAGDYEWFVRSHKLGVTYKHVPFKSVIFNDKGITNKLLYKNYLARKEIAKRLFPNKVYEWYCIWQPYYFLKFKLLQKLNVTKIYRLYKKNKYN